MAIQRSRLLAQYLELRKATKFLFLSAKGRENILIAVWKNETTVPVIYYFRTLFVDDNRPQMVKSWSLLLQPFRSPQASSCRKGTWRRFKSCLDLSSASFRRQALFDAEIIIYKETHFSLCAPWILWSYPIFYVLMPHPVQSRSSCEADDDAGSGIQHNLNALRRHSSQAIVPP